MDVRELARGELNPEKYPVATRLIKGGVRALYEYARGLGFMPDTYISKCELCYFIREFLARTRPTRDVAPDCFYESMRAAYARET